MVKSEPDWAKNGDYYWSWWGIVSMKACYDLYLIWLINFIQSLTYSLSKNVSKTSSKGGKGCSKTSLKTFTFDLKTCFKSTAHHLQTGILFVKHINKISGNIKAKWKRKYDSKQKCFRGLLGPWPLTWKSGKRRYAKGK